MIKNNEILFDDIVWYREKWFALTINIDLVIDEVYKDVLRNEFYM
jgi:hypothetical protein